MNDGTVKKIVYVLGAGFSIPAGGPSQARILNEILDLDESCLEVRRKKAALKTFITKDLGISLRDMHGVPLEDIYTPLDRCIADGISFKNRPPSNLVKLRSDLGGLISRAIGAAITRFSNDRPGAPDYIARFASYIVGLASKRAEYAQNTDDAEQSKQYDPLAIISLNWDILLDNALHDALHKDRLRTCARFGDYDPFGVVDYCCYVSSLEPGDERIRSGLWSLGCRGYNVKLLKPHGSMNWLQCPNCQRLFVEFGQKMTIVEQIGRTSCRHCLRLGYQNRLQGSLVMPTFLKDLSNFQIKLVWQNTSVELMEAEHLDFIGYSLPHADFEFRQLLARTVRQKATVEVVLFRGKEQESVKNYEAECARYKQFFGRRRIQFHPDGAEAYMTKLPPVHQLPIGAQVRCPDCGASHAAPPGMDELIAFVCLRCGNPVKLPRSKVC
jgi:hypothetical protein